MAKHLLSFDLRADFACFKKPDINVGMNLTFNCLHKPALLGILGAITGLKGYSKKGEFPEYYKVFKDLPVGIEPIEGFHEKGNFTKTIVKYTNTVGYANADGNLIIAEQTLIRPAYRCYLLLNDSIEVHEILQQRLLKGEAVYLPYLGKNEFSAWWDIETVYKHPYDVVESIDESFTISSLFIKNLSLKENEAQNDNDAFDFMDMTLKPEVFFYFERLPVGFNEALMQYQLADFSYSNVSIKLTKKLNSIYGLKESNKYVHLF